MKRTQIYLNDSQHEFFKNEAGKLGIGMSELIRTALDNYMKKDTLHTPSITLKKQLPSDGGGLVIIPPELWDIYISYE